MEKIDLPIEKNYEDTIKPSNPDFWWLWKMLIITVPLFLISYIFFYLFSYFVIWNISIEKEKELFWEITNNWKKIDINNYLNNKINNLKNIDIFITDSDEINAYALLWWKIELTEWLLNEIKYEEELIFIIWHEMEHIKNRDVLNSLLTEIPFYLTLQFIWFDLNNDISKISTNYINRYTEINADDWWIKLINQMWLNLDCSLEFFKRDNWKFNNYFLLLSDHPTNDKRINNLEKNNLNKNKKCNIFTYNKKD